MQCFDHNSVNFVWFSLTFLTNIQVWRLIIYLSFCVYEVIQRSKGQRSNFDFFTILAKIWAIRGHNLVNIMARSINFHINLHICKVIICSYFYVNEVIQRSKGQRSNFDFSTILRKIWVMQGHNLVNIMATCIKFHIHLHICKVIMCGYFCVNEVIQSSKGQRSNIDFFTILVKIRVI